MSPDAPYARRAEESLLEALADTRVVVLHRAHLVRERLLGLTADARSEVDAAADQAVEVVEALQDDGHTMARESALRDPPRSAPPCSRAAAGLGRL